ncbi:unnamed protein product, partial [marine sediment metagenome]
YNKMYFESNNAHPYRTVPARKNEFFHSGGRSGGEYWKNNKQPSYKDKVNL